MLVRSLALDAGAQGVEREVSQVLGVVVFARNECVEPAGQPIDRGIEVWILFIGEDDVEVAVQLGGSELSEVLGYEGEAYQVGLGALQSR